MRRLAASVLLGAVVLTGAGGCTTNPATGEQSFTAFMSPAEERRVGAQEHPKLVEQFGGGYGDASLQAYVDRIGQSLAQHAEIQDIRYTFVVLDTDDVNAFALPGGYIHVTRGLVGLAGSEAELASVLGHEIGHVTARHAAQRYSTAAATSLGIGVLGVLGAIAGVPAGLGDLAGAGLQTGAALYLQSYSRDQEREADELGIRYMTRAGYDPAAMASFFGKLDAFARLEANRAGGADTGFDIMASHPRTDERERAATQMAAAVRQPGAVVDRDEYLAQIDGLTWGDSPEQGIRRGRDFVHPGLRIAFTVPPGFALQNSPRQVQAIHRDGAVIAFDADTRDDVGQRVPDMATYLTRVWAPKVELRGVQRFEVEGQSAATGSTRLGARGGPIDVRLVAIRGGPDRIWRFVFLSQPRVTGRFSDDFQQTAYSFRRLSAAEAAAIRPKRIRIVTTRPGDTAESLAGRMAVDQNATALFRTINGLQPGQQPTPGQKVKLVVE